MHNKDHGKLLLLHLAAVSAAGAVAAAVRVHRRRRKQKMQDSLPVPRLVLADAGSRVVEIEHFSHYVARQIGFGSINECPHVGKLAYDYLRKTKGWEDLIFTFFSTDPNYESLYVKFIEELDRCIVAYFSFHWSHATLMISQVLSVNTEPRNKLKKFVMEATRKQRFERITKDLKVARVFTTLVEEMKAIGLGLHDDRCTDVMVPAAHCDRSPVLLLMGGGMGAGKSTVLKDILKDAFWSGAAGNAVVVEADAFKETDVIYRALSSRGHHDMLQTAELVHQSSTDAASSLLVTALNEGRDVIMDGTLSWAPFVEQTIAMARAVHRRRYRMGVGYKVADDGSTIENYWEPVDEEEDNDNAAQPSGKKPYRIELVGVVCDAYLAVVRGIRRAIMVRRAVRVGSQLKSHKRFAGAFPGYCKLVDNARLYYTNSIGAPRLIGWKDAESNLLVDPEEIICLEKVARLKEDANSVYNLHLPADSAFGQGSIWHDHVFSSSRSMIQEELKSAIQLMEKQHPLI